MPGARTGSTPGRRRSSDVVSDGWSDRICDDGGGVFVGELMMRRWLVVVAVVATVALFPRTAGAANVERSRPNVLPAAGTATGEVIAVRTDSPVAGRSDASALCIDGVLEIADWRTGEAIGPISLPVGTHTAEFGAQADLASCSPTVPVTSVSFDVVAGEQSVLYTVAVAQPGSDFVALAATSAACNTGGDAALIALLTTGSPPGPGSWSYDIDIDGSVAYSGAGPGTVARMSMPAGPHDVTVAGYAPPSFVSIDGPMRIDATPGESTLLFYPSLRAVTVDCAASVVVVATTTTSTSTSTTAPQTTTPSITETTTPDPSSIAPAAAVPASPSFAG
jgi:hypothetical protein